MCYSCRLEYEKRAFGLRKVFCSTTGLGQVSGRRRNRITLHVYICMNKMHKYDWHLIFRRRAHPVPLLAQRNRGEISLSVLLSVLTPAAARWRSLARDRVAVQRDGGETPCPRALCSLYNTHYPFQQTHNHSSNLLPADRQDQICHKNIYFLKILTFFFSKWRVKAH